MPESSTSSADRAVSPGRKTLAYAVHVLTATGVVCAFLTAAAIFYEEYARAFFWMLVALLIDSIDGPTARLVRVREVLPNFDGRRLDDIVDYLNYTFLPIVLIWRAGWLPAPGWLWTAVPLIASLIAFCNVGAKEEEDGFFVGFPSYWNVVAIYTGLCFRHLGPYVVLGLVLFLSAISVLPLRFVYPNLATRWRGFFIIGAVLWAAAILVMLPLYPHVPGWLSWGSLSYPALYVVLSVYLDFSSRRQKAAG